MELTVDDGYITEVACWGGCNGNLQGLAKLGKCMFAVDVLSKLEGVKCGRRATSCPDQLCKALHQMGF